MGEGLVASVIGPTGPEHRRLAHKVMEEALSSSRLQFTDLTYIIATGYGRINVPFADKQVTEITCHAKGLHSLLPTAKTVVDIGGQDSKGIKLKNGKVTGFVMNDKCAAGTGRFLEVIAAALGVLHHHLLEVQDEPDRREIGVGQQVVHVLQPPEQLLAPIIDSDYKTYAILKTTKI